MRVEITELVELDDGDGVLVVGLVDGEPAEARVWKSHLFGDHAAVNKQRARDANREEIEIPRLEAAEMLATDADRKRYLAEQLAATVRADAPRGDLAKLPGTVRV